MKVTITWERLPSCKGNTIYEALCERLGREPTDAEIKSEIQRILREAKP